MLHVVEGKRTVSASLPASGFGRARTSSGNLLNAYKTSLKLSTTERKNVRLSADYGVKSIDFTP